MSSSRTAPRLGADERRAQLLEAALETFGAKGFTATSMNDVAGAAGVTKPVVYQHFDSKHHLYLELLSQTGAQLVAAIQDAVAAAEGPRQQVENAFHAYVDFFAQAPARFTVVYGQGVRLDPSFATELAAIEDISMAFTADMIEIAGLSRDDRLFVARSLVSILEGAVRRWIHQGATRDPSEVATLMSEFAWRGLRGIDSDTVARLHDEQS